jgi:alpha-1,6-mannosyltransferase
MKILQTANVVAPDSGGNRTTLQALARGYRAAGHAVVQIVPGSHDRRSIDDDVELITVRAPRVPGTGYRMIVDTRRMLRLLDDIRPDRIEISDRFTPQAVGRWARRHGVPTVVISHERLDAVLAAYVRSPRLARSMADFWNLRLATAFDTIVCASDWAGQEFQRLGVPNLADVPLGVDLSVFHPDRASADLRRELVAGEQPLLVMANRLAPEKQPRLAIATIAELHRLGTPAHLVVAGTGPMVSACRRSAASLPVTFLGYVADRARLAQLLATADVVLAPAPFPAVGLTALEALASGTPVVGRRGSGLTKMLETAGGATAPGSAAEFAQAVRRIITTDARRRRLAARAAAQCFGWSTTVQHMLATHRIPA